MSRKSNLINILALISVALLIFIAFLYFKPRAVETPPTPEIAPNTQPVQETYNPNYKETDKWY